MSDLDFSDLSDDQIVELAAGLAQEALRRSPALAAAFKEALVTEKERIEAAARGGMQAKREALAREAQLHKRLEDEKHRAREREEKQNRAASILREAAQIVERPLSDVTLVLTSFPSGKPQLYLNPGANVEGYGSVNLVHYDVEKQSIRTSWKLEAKKKELLCWAESSVAALRAMNIPSITIKGIEL